MVAPGLLALDILETSIYFAAPALLWLFAYALAYAEPELAREGGFDRLTFWLLVPSALLGEFANVLFFGFGNDFLAINVGGGLIPIVLSVWLLHRVLPGPRRSLAELLAAAALGTGLALAIVELSLSGAPGQFGPGLAALVPGVALAVLAGTSTGAERARRGLVASVALLFGAAVLATQLSTAAVPGLGIVSVFPTYLIAPVGLGALSAVVVRRRAGGGLGPALAVAYASVTLGVLVGADVLHQPPLYGPGAPALYAIGGAGLLDLLHLSGLLALAGAYAVVVVLRRPGRAPAAETPVAAAPSRLIRRSWYLGLEGRYDAAVRDAGASVDRAVAQARRLHRLPPAAPGRAWEGLPDVPLWVPLDHANLTAVAAGRETAARDAYRSWLTARALVSWAGRIAERRRARPNDRALAFAIDLALLAAGFIAVDVALFAPVRPGTAAFLNGIVFEGAIVGASGWGLAYFLLFEGWAATTPGKRLLGLAVRSTGGGPPGLRETWIRNLPRIVPVTIVAYAVAYGTAGLLLPRAFGGAAAASTLVAIVGTAAFVGLVLCGLLAMLTVASTEEGQRIGDLLAGTWVVRAPPTAEARAGAPSSPWGTGSSPPASG